MCFSSVTAGPEFREVSTINGKTMAASPGHRRRGLFDVSRCASCHNRTFMPPITKKSLLPHLMLGGTSRIRDTPVALYSDLGELKFGHFFGYKRGYHLKAVFAF
jgi:hypothetical protein